ncbi:uncharacterized protein MYCFIDRAFT_151927 [Pseudocercospora fijiensis CIRAD86]|uniref:FAD-binding domain-containing protein n=1 Tax=Pseudocercospora fijiensis (strain CIRAD86) TaxID=383855 RepID=M3BCP9_PSEFD|nr:uncharacterized protein MYCFIDRAFT_151927 [Pseudocercospora fijiensis CIRAD86]EME86943.1 hypothetical protein MYCFIDRAFT_151927 [Pseudocercospora fijiensis CIRAD86]
MRVIIVGGGIAGLTFANALEKAGIDFVLLEARPLLDPQVGASIGLGPNALRIYDQFGAAQEIIDQTTPLTWTVGHGRDGKRIAPPAAVFRLLEPRLGYGFSFLDRQLVLRAAANTIKQQERLLLNKRLASIDHFDSGVKVHCEDGTSYSGDIVVGCDGVNSKVRSEMWRIAAQEDATFFTHEEKTRLGAEFTCLFGISHHVSGFDHEGQAWQTYDKGKSFLLITGKDCRLYWFYFQKMDKLYKVSDADFPRFTKKDAEDVAAQTKHRKCHEWATFGDIWDKRISYTLVPMEEALFDKWSWGRIATIGDNAHKMTANHGQAGNNAVESAAALANQVKRLHDAGSNDVGSITRAFHAWRDKRRVRVEGTCKEAALVCRMQSLDNFMAYVFEFWMVPLLSDIVINMQTDNIRGAELLEWLPVPERSMSGNMPFNQYQGVGKKESLLFRALKASPLLLLSAFVAHHTGGHSLDRHMLQLLQPTRTRDDAWCAAFLFMTNESLLYSIWLIENHRRANRVAPARLAWLFGIFASTFGFGVITPIWFFFHYIFSAIEHYAAGDMRLTDLAYTRTIMPVRIGFVILPLMLKYLAFDIPIAPDVWYWMWVFSVLSITAIQTTLAKTGISKDTMQHDALHNCLADLPTLRLGMYTMALSSTVAWILPKFVITSHAASDTDDLLYFNRIGTSASSVLWLSMLFLDLYQAGMLQINMMCLAVMGGCAAAGVPIPALVAVGFAWREQILATKRARFSITKDKFSGKSVLEVEPEAIAQPVSAHPKVPITSNGHVEQSANGSAKGSFRQM